MRRRRLRRVLQHARRRIRLRRHVSWLRPLAARRWNGEIVALAVESYDIAFEEGVAKNARHDRSAIHGWLSYLTSTLIM